MMRTGQRAGYWMVEWGNGCDASLRDLVPVCPAIVLGRRAVIASWDSGTYRPTSEDLAAGWQSIGQLAVSPRIEAVDALPLLHFEEYYLYDREPVLAPHRHFVNRCEFSPLAEGDAETEAFWAQIAQHRPDHVAGAGSPALFLVTRDEALWRAAIAAVTAYGPP